MVSHLEAVDLICGYELLERAQIARHCCTAHHVLLLVRLSLNLVAMHQMVCRILKCELRRRSELRVCGVFALRNVRELYRMRVENIDLNGSRDVQSEQQDQDRP